MPHGPREPARSPDCNGQRYRFDRQRSRLNAVRGRRAGRGPTTRPRPRATRRRPGRRSRRPGGAGARRRRPGTATAELRQGALDLGEPLAAVGEVVVERAEGVVEDRAVRRPERARPRPTPRGRASARSSRSRARAGRRGGRPPSCRGRAPCRRSAARRSAGSTSEIESAVCPGVVTHPQLQPVDVDQLAVGERVGVEAVRRVEGADRRSPCGSRTRRATSEWSKWWWVSSTSATSPVCSSSSSRWPSSIGPGSMTTDRRGAGLAEHPGVGAVERHHPGVRREQAARPLAERPAGPGSLMTPVRGASSGRSRSGIDSVQPSPSASTAGREHLDGRDRARRRAPRPGPAYCATSSEVRYVGGIISISPRRPSPARRRPAAR